MKNLLTRIYNLTSPLFDIIQLNISFGKKIFLFQNYLSILFHKFEVNKRNKIHSKDFVFNYLTIGDLIYLYREIFINQEYLFSTSQEKPLIIDCGSNIGFSILFFKNQFPKARIIGFEPNSETYACLKQNILDNHLNDIVVYENAVSGKDEMLELYYDEDQPGLLSMSKIQNRLPKQKKQVHAVLLSSFINEEVDFLKMDIEGSEGDVLLELANSNKLRFIKQMVIEFHLHITESEDKLSELLGILETAGFGYQISARLARPFVAYQFQDILIFTYQKHHIV